MVLALEKDFIGSFVKMSFFDMDTAAYDDRLGCCDCRLELCLGFGLDFVLQYLSLLRFSVFACERERMQLMNLRCRAVFWQPKAPTFVDDVRQ